MPHHTNKSVILYRQTTLWKRRNQILLKEIKIVQITEATGFFRRIYLIGMNKEKMEMPKDNLNQD